MLQQIGIYLLKVICISGLLFLYYHVALRNKRFHYYNRFYLLMAVITSIALPLLRLEWFTFFSSSKQTIQLYKIMYGNGEEDVAITGNTVITSEQIILYILCLISFCLLVILCVRVITLKLLKRKYPVQQFNEFDFINTDINSAPFSFMKNIFWRNDISLEDETGKQILQHEITHIQQKHSWDKLFMQFILCFYWTNPFFHLIKRELYLIHEFIADEEAVKHADANAFAKMLLTAQFGKFNFLPAQSIFYSSIKRRLTMLTTSKKPQFSYVRRLLALPLLAALICLFAFTVKTRNSSNTISPVVLSKPFVLVVDAGHGGKDHGALGNGLYEKDVTLKIAQQIKDLSSQYNINVILTRNSDVFMDPKEKSEFANSQNADAFISIHVNANNTQPIQSGFEVILSKKNKQFETNSQVLGSAILQNLLIDFKGQQILHQRNASIWILDQSNKPSAIIECGYLTNSNDASLLKDDEKIEFIAKSILQGAALYANNAFDKSKLYQLQNVQRKDTIPPSLVKAEVEPLYVLDGKIVSKEALDKLDKNLIESVNVWKDKSATDKYGDKGKDGVVEITMKKTDKVDAATVNALYVLDGKIVTKEKIDKLDPNAIESINVLKDKQATDKYGDKGINGVLEIITKKDKQELGSALNTSQAKETIVQVLPQFPGGIEGWKDYLAKNLDASLPAKKNGPPGTYTVAVSFKVDKDGKVSDVRTSDDPGFGTGKEAVRVIAEGPDWIPAKKDNQPLASIVQQKIIFKVSN